MMDIDIYLTCLIVASFSRERAFSLWSWFSNNITSCVKLATSSPCDYFFFLVGGGVKYIYIYLKFKKPLNANTIGI